MKKKYSWSLILFAASYPVCAQQDTTVMKTDSLMQTDSGATVAPAAAPVPDAGKKQVQPVYRINPAVDIPVTAIAAGWSAFAFTKIYSKDNSTEEQIMNLRESDIPAFDRWAVKPFDERIDNISYIPFYAAIPAPLFLLVDKKIRKDGWKVMYLYLEAMSITGLLYTGSMYLTNRYRPYTYHPESPMDKRRTGNAKNSFYAGHVHLVGTSAFFMAKVLCDYHPEWKSKWVAYGLASAVTGATAWMRHEAGMHFPSDLILGFALSAATGILVPELHKNKSPNDRLSITPVIGGASNGISLVYKLR